MEKQELAETEQRLRELCAGDETLQTLVMALGTVSQASCWVIDEMLTHVKDKAALDLIQRWLQHVQHAPFEASKVLDNLQRLEPWFESRRKDLLMAASRRKQDMKTLLKKLGDRIELPYRALLTGGMRGGEGEQSFKFGEIIAIAGDVPYVQYILLQCAKHFSILCPAAYVVLRSRQTPLAPFAAPRSLTHATWANSMAVPAEFELLMKRYLPDGGLIVVEDTESLVMPDGEEKDGDRTARITNAFMQLHRYVLNHAAAAIIGMSRLGMSDDYLRQSIQPVGVAPTADGTAVCLGNETIPMAKLQGGLS